MRRSPYLFAEGLTEWLKGHDTQEAEAAAQLVAETILVLRAFCRGSED